MTPIICIVGRTGSGKTRLIELLIGELKARGYSVGTVKHHKHNDFEIDLEGKDTWKHAKAGSDTVVISSPTKLALIKKMTYEAPLDEIRSSYLADRDIVLAEGFTLSDKPRIIVAENEEDIEIFSKGREVLAVVSNSLPNCYDFASIGQLADRIEKYKFGKRNI